jgi:hypothetical protein
VLVTKQDITSLVPVESESFIERNEFWFKEIGIRCSVSLFGVGEHQALDLLLRDVI